MEVEIIPIEPDAGNAAEGKHNLQIIPLASILVIMRGLFFMAAALGCICTGAYAQDQEKVEQLDSVIVAVSRAGRNTPVTYTYIGKEEL